MTPLSIHQLKTAANITTTIEFSACIMLVDTLPPSLGKAKNKPILSHIMAMIQIISINRRPEVQSLKFTERAK